ncbi:MAG: glycosyltransferase, partial [Bacteroidota bacterium]
MRILILYSELAGYNLPCLQALASRETDIHLVRWPVNKEAPFDFGDIPGITVYERDAFDTAGLLGLAEQVQPQAMYVAGWMDKGYTAVARHWRSRGIPVICALDNHWRGDLRQQIAALLSPFHIKRMFSHLWVPGIHQYEFARRLGFPPTHIRTGMYSADVAPFLSLHRSVQTSDGPSELLYVGRFVENKGILELVEVFSDLTQTQSDHNWRLRMVGAGPLQGRLPHHPHISYQGFVQPAALPALAARADA